MVDRRHDIVNDLGILLVAVDALLDDGLVVDMKRNAGIVETAGSHEMTRLDFEHVVLAVAVLVEPLADRVAVERRLDILRPIAPVGINPARHGLDEDDMRDLRRDDEFEPLVARHVARQPAGQA